MLAGDALRGQARELNIAPINVVQDPNAFDGQVRTGRSCLTCHVNGEIAKQDQIRENVLRNGIQNATVEDPINLALALFPKQEEMNDLYEKDQNIYRSALAALNISNINERTMHSVHLRHLDELDAADVAGILGITEEELLRGLDFAAGDARARAFTVLSTPRGLVDRDVIDAGLRGLAEAIGLGVGIEPQN